VQFVLSYWIDTKPKVPRAVSKYLPELARRANAVLRGSESARIRSAKGVAGRLRKAAMPERTMIMKPKKSHEEILEGLSNEDLYPPIAEDGSRRSALLKILDDLTRVEVTVSRIPDVPPEITKMVSFTLCRLRNRIVKTFPEDFPLTGIM